MIEENPSDEDEEDKHSESDNNSADSVDISDEEEA
jgi:hypothetical protein